MSYYAYDTNGYLGDVASISGWASFAAAAANLDLVRDGFDTDLDRLVAELEQLGDNHHKLRGGDESVRSNLEQLARRADSLLIVSDGEDADAAPPSVAEKAATALLLAKSAIKKAKKSGTNLAAVSDQRPACRIAVKKLTRVLKTFFADAKKKIIADVVRAVHIAGVTKATFDTSQVDEVMGAVDLTVFNSLPKKIQPLLEPVYSSAGHEALRTVAVAVNIGHGPDVANDAWSQVDEGAVEYASLRGAEMVGMRRDESGALYPNPDAKWQITESTRDGIRSLVTQTVRGDISVKDLPRALEESYGFSAARAEMIARTEVHMANGEGALAGLVAAGNVDEKVWLTQDDDLVSDECQENADEGPIPLLDEFPSGDLTEPAHPNCRCSVVGHVDWGTDEE